MTVPASRGHGRTVPREWRLDEALARQPGLSVIPSPSPGVTLTGALRMHHSGPTDVVIDECYAVTITVPPTFPRALPRVVETQGRIARTFHRNPDNSLCLGSPLALRLAINGEPTIDAFIERAVVPYLYSHAFHARFGRMPFGELDHGYAGLADDVRRLFRLPPQTCAEEFLRLGGLKRRHANKHPCPCHSGLRVGRCHGPAVRDVRRRLGRGGCREQYSVLVRERSAERAAQESLRRRLVARTSFRL
jgi:hypothetical protein